MTLTGTYIRAIDEKLRVAIPKRLRDALACRPGHALYIAPGTDGSLAIYSEDAFSQLGQRLAAASPNRRDVRAFRRLFYAQAQRVQIDRQGRVRVPAELARLAALDKQKEAVLIGVDDHMELWAAEKWQQYLTSQQAQYDRVAETAFDASGQITEPDQPG
jgi:MraZ protein